MSEALSLLIIDDEEEFAQTLARRLELRDMRVRVATNGEAGLLAVAEAAPDAILLDMRMPGLSGVEVLARLRGGVVPRAADVPVIIVSGHASRSDADKAEALGVSATLPKPVDMDDLLAAIRQVTGGPA
jgi:CheY-like chemotaxis protein